MDFYLLTHLLLANFAPCQTSVCPFLLLFFFPYLALGSTLLSSITSSVQH